MRVHIGILNREIEEKNEMNSENDEEKQLELTLRKGHDLNLIQEMQKEINLKTIDEKKLKEDSIVIVEEAKHSL